MSSAPVRGNPLPNPDRLPAQQRVNPAPQMTAPQLNNVAIPEDPRGTKRAREGGNPESEAPVLKLARTETAAEPVDLRQQALLAAIQGGDLERVLALIRSFPKLLNSYFPGPHGPTPLCLAAHHGQLDIAAALLRAGAPVDAPARNGSTPLMFAAQSGQVKVIELCCSFGADPHQTNKLGGFDALAYAIKKKQLAACKLLINQCVDMRRKLILPVNGNPNNKVITPLRGAIAVDFSELIAWWLDVTGLTVEMKDVGLDTSMLNSAVAFGSVAVIRMLVERGAKLDSIMKTSDGKTLCGIWEVAEHANSLGVIECLLNLGLRPKLGDHRLPVFGKTMAIGLTTDL